MTASTDRDNSRSSDDATLAILQHDPAWEWLRDAAEDVYSEDDVRTDHSA